VAAVKFDLGQILCAAAAPVNCKLTAVGLMASKKKACLQAGEQDGGKKRCLFLIQRGSAVSSDMT